MDTTFTSQPVVLTPDGVDALPAESLGHLEGVTHRVLWHDETSMAGMLSVPSGHRLGAHTHRVNHHHIWVTDGRATILGADLGPGSYVHIPSGIEHDIDASGTSGCTVFYLYAPRPT